MITIASDHAGFSLKKDILVLLDSLNVRYTDLGPSSDSRVDYPDYADRLCHHLRTADADEKGILVCGSGQGMAMRANKYPFIRAAICWNPELAKLAREHNDSNVLCLGSRVIEASLIKKIIVTFLETPFAEGRHTERVRKIGEKI